MRLMVAWVLFALQLQIVAAFSGFALSSKLSRAMIGASSERYAKQSCKRARPIWHLAAAAAAGAADVGSEALFDAIEAGDAEAVQRYIEGILLMCSKCVKHCSLSKQTRLCLCM
jgi:hypothetical protein